jgi:biotin transport system substrate-specific component
MHMTTATSTLPGALQAVPFTRTRFGGVILVIAASLLIGLSARFVVPIPFSPVPMTLQPLAILLVGAALGWKRGAAATALYLAQGAAGMPFFAGGLGGPGVLLGPTAGYLFAFPAAAAIAGVFSERGQMRSVAGTAAGMALAIATIHLGGFSWLVAGWGFGVREALLAGVVPFLLSDVVKIAIAATLIPAVQRILPRE